MLSIQSDDHFMKIAFQEAQIAYDKGEVPVGAVVVAHQKVIAKAHNQTELLKDVTAHAEMLAITSAAHALGGKYLNECTLYVTLEPCAMCAGALKWAQLGRLVYGAEDDKGGYSTIDSNLLHQETEVAFGVMRDQCSELLSSFFKERRARKRYLKNR